MSFAGKEASRYSGAPVSLYLVAGANNLGDEDLLGPWGFNNGETQIVRTITIGETDVEVIFYPWPIKDSGISQDGTLDKSDLTLSLALGSPVDDIFLAYPPSQLVNLTIFEGHVGETEYVCIWMGRITGAGWRENELELSCQPVSSAIRRPGLRRPYSLGCPHVLFGPHCKASKSAATISRQATSVTGNQVTLNTALGAAKDQFVGGLLEWINPANSLREIRTITAVNTAGTILTIRGTLRGIAAGTALSVVRGCNRQMSGCNTHSNILNYGGQPFIPLENPLSQKNQFY